MEKEFIASPRTETARVRQFTRDTLNAGSIKQQVPSSASNKSEGRSRLFSLSSLSGRRKFQSGVDESLATEIKREDPESLAAEGTSPAMPGALSPPGAASWLSASTLTSGLLYNGYDANKDPKNEAKSDCSVM